jgi:hypothetical protein
VPKVLRAALIVVAAIIALFAIVLIGANLYVQSRGTQARIQQELSHRLGVPVQVRRVSITPWGSLILSGLTVAQGRANGSRDFLEAESFYVRPRFSSLLRGHIEINQVAIVDPTVIWPQDANGKWRLPAAVVEETATVATEQTEEALSAPNESAPAATASVPPSPSAERRPEERTRALITHVAVKNGTFEFLDGSGATFAKFSGVQFRSTIDSPADVRGDARIETADLRNRFGLTKLQSPVRYTSAQLALPKIIAHSAGGDVTGAMTIQLQTPGSPLDVNLRLRNIDADTLVRQAGGPGATIEGKLDGTLAVQGPTGDINALTGSGELVLRNGQLRQYNLLVMLGQILQIDELTQLRLEQAEAKYRLANGSVIVDQLLLRSPNIRLTASGRIDLNGKLRLQSQLAINDKVRDQLFKPVRANFQPLDEPGLSAVDFEITGTLERPKTNLLEKVVGRDVKDLGDVVRSFLGVNKPEKAKKKRRDANLPNDTPPPEESAASPTP